MSKQERAALFICLKTTYLYRHHGRHCHRSMLRTSIHDIFRSHPSLITRSTFLVVFYRLKYQKHQAFSIKIAFLKIFHV